MKKIVVLPPLISKITNGEISWRSLGDVDTDLVGYFLSCHLMVEHYLDQTLKEYYPTLDWDAARLTFQQKISLISTDLQTDPAHSAFDLYPAAKHMNVLGNKLAHNVEFKIAIEHLTPLVNYLKNSKRGCSCGDSQKAKRHPSSVHHLRLFFSYIQTSKFQTGSAEKEEGLMVRPEGT